jgi:O-methyltransferase
MRAVLAAYGIENRKVFVADSFEGLPRPDERYPADRGDKHHLNTYLAVSLDEVKNNFRKYSLLDDKVVFLEGWFKNTLPTAPIEKLSVLRLDGDVYGSTLEALLNLYPRLSMGGFCIIDDYNLVLLC